MNLSNDVVDGPLKKDTEPGIDYCMMTVVQPTVFARSITCLQKFLKLCLHKLYLTGKF